MRAYVTLAERVGIKLRIDLGSISLRSPANGILSLFYVSPEKGGLYVEYFRPFSRALDAAAREDIVTAWGGKCSHVPANEASTWLLRLEPVLRQLAASARR